MFAEVDSGESAHMAVTETGPKSPEEDTTFKRLFLSSGERKLNSICVIVQTSETSACVFRVPFVVEIVKLHKTGKLCFGTPKFGNFGFKKVAESIPLQVIFFIYFSIVMAIVPL